jgi:hypothetical protein
MRAAQSHACMDEPAKTGEKMKQSKWHLLCHWCIMKYSTYTFKTIYLMRLLSISLAVSRPLELIGDQFLGFFFIMCAQLMEKDKGNNNETRQKIGPKGCPKHHNSYIVKSEIY